MDEKGDYPPVYYETTAHTRLHICMALSRQGFSGEWAWRLDNSVISANTLFIPADVL